MKYKMTVILILVLLSFNHINGQDLSEDAKKLAQKALNYSENNDHYNAVKYLEQLLNNYKLNSGQNKAVKNVLRNEYLSISKKLGENDNPNFKFYCIKGIEIGKDINQEYDWTALMFHYYMIGHYYYYGNKQKMNEWISSFHKIRNSLETDLSQKLINEMDSWTNSGISKMKRYVNSSASSSSTFSFSFNDLVSKPSNNNAQTTSKKKLTKTKVTKTEKCCTDTKLGDEVTIYYAFTNKYEKIHLYYYPHLNKWHFANGWGEKFRGNKFYASLEKIIEDIENE